MSNSGQITVASGHPLTSQAAIEIMAEGGNAFDAVVAAGFTAAVAEPALTSLGGGGFLLAATSSGEEIMFDFFSDTPGLGLPENDLEPHFFNVTIEFSGTAQDFKIGLGSVAVPGNLKGFIHAHTRLGGLPLEKIVQPAIRAARNGVVVNLRQAHFLELLYPIMTLSDTGKKLYEPGGKYLKEGMTYFNHDLADFLEKLPLNNGDDFYTGKIASEIASEMRSGNGLLSEKDLASYRVKERRPLAIEYRGHRFLTNPPPSFGGTLIGATLQLMETAPLSEMAWGSSEHLKVLGKVLEEIDKHRDSVASAADRNNLEWLSSASREIRRMFSRGTTHISVSDSMGNHAAMTTSNGEGSGYIVPGTGIMLNNMMGEDDLHPDGFHSSPSGLRVASMMSPSMLVGEKGVEMVIGSGGSKRIRTAIPQVISNVVDFGIAIEQAVELPRIHWDGETMQVEPGYEEAVIEELKNIWPVNAWSNKGVYFGGVHAIYNGEPAGDPRRGGTALKKTAT
ncbi:MAG: gamma-glutamyltransferase [Thermodesulfobacteriota bacterium]